MYTGHLHPLQSFSPDQWARVQPTPVPTHTENTALVMCDWLLRLHCTSYVCKASFSPVQPQFQVLVWTQEVSSLMSDLWSPTPQAHTVQAFYTKHIHLRIFSGKNKHLNAYLFVAAYVEHYYLNRRLVQSCHICSVFSWLRNSLNFPCSRVSICVKKWHVRTGRDTIACDCRHPDITSDNVEAKKNQLAVFAPSRWAMM